MALVIHRMIVDSDHLTYGDFFRFVRGFCFEVDSGHRRSWSVGPFRTP